MLPTRIRLTNFLSYEATEIDYTGCHLVALAGENGAGKSALAVDALTWCLWGEARGRSDDDLVRQGADECEVEVQFEAGGQLHGVVRRRRLPRDGRAGVSALAFQLYGSTYDTGYQDLTRETIRETQEAINAACGMDYKTFTHTACLIQGQADQFTTAAPGARKDVLVSLLGLTAWQDWATVAHERLRASQADLAAADASLAAAAEELQRASGLDQLVAAIEEQRPALIAAVEEARIALDTVQDRRQRQAGLKAELGAIVEANRRQTVDMEATEGRLAEITTSLFNLPTLERIGNLRLALRNCETAAARFAPLQEQAQARALAEAVHSQAQGRLPALEGAVAAAEAALQALPAAPTDLKRCPTCGQEVKGEAYDKMVADLESRRTMTTEALRVAGKALANAAQATGEAEDHLRAMPAVDGEALAEARTAARELPEYKAAVAGAEQQIASADQLQSLQRDLLRSKQVGQSELAGRGMRIKALQSAMEIEGDAKADLDRWANELRLRQASLDEQNARRCNLEGQLEAVARTRASADQTRQSRAVVADYASLWEQLEATFGPRGIQAMLIDAALPQITDEANRLLALMASGTTIELTTQRAGKTTGRQIETLDVIIADAQGTRPYENYSGGERFRIDFAIRIALSRLLARRAQAPCEVLIVDEGFGSQDGNGRTGLVEALATVKAQFRLIMVISHIDDLRELFPQVITVTKTATGSRASLS
jgi:exonuclease SbcC